MKFKILFILAIVLIVIGFSFWLLKKNTGADLPFISETQSKIFRDSFAVQKARAEWNANLSATAAVDRDFDGLTNDEEINFGTNPDAADTDGDGFFDKTEIKINKTNPLKKE